MKKTALIPVLVLLAAALCLPVSAEGTDYMEYYDNLRGWKYTSEEGRLEAEDLFGVSFTVEKETIPVDPFLPSVYTLVSADFPFPLHITSYLYDLEGGYLGRHMSCDYYTQMMDRKAAEAGRIAEKYGLKPERSGQELRVSIGGYDDLAKVFGYLNETNDLYDFRMNEGAMGGLLYDIRSRPSLIPYISDSSGEEADILTLYYVVNHDMFPYEKDALLPAMQEAYISATDALGMRDPAVTDLVRASRVKPALTQLLLNGEALEPLACDGFTLDPNIVFDYNWSLKEYCGDIRICFPAADYDAPPGYYGDDRNFKYLVELLGGSYTSKLDDSLIANYYTAEWYLGGDRYGAGTYTQSYIPTQSALSKNNVGLPIPSRYSKEMWGLEDGYSADDFCVRVTPGELAMILGVTAEADYEKGTLNLITPEGYFDHELPAPGPGTWKEQFKTESVLSDNGLAVKNTHYTVYRSDGTFFCDGTTKDYTYAECTQADENVVAVRVSGVGSVNETVFYFTDTGEVSPVYPGAILLRYPYIAYTPAKQGKILIANVRNGQEITVTDDACVQSVPGMLRDAVLSDDGGSIRLTYYKENKKTGGFDTVTKDFS